MKPIANKKFHFFIGMKNPSFDEIVKSFSWISLVGMSGTGKSYWSGVMSFNGFKRFRCDDMIEDRLLLLLNPSTGKSTDLGDWVGFPFEPGYNKKEKIYLTLEIETRGEIIAYLETPNPLEKIVIDTTGFAPYAGDEIMQRLRELTCIVHLAASDVFLFINA